MTESQNAFALPKGSVRAILALAFTTAVCYTWAVVGKAPTGFFTFVIGIWAFYFGQKALSVVVKPKAEVAGEVYPLWLPKHTIRAVIAIEVALVACYLWVIKGKVDPQVIKGVAIVVGFYFLQNALSAVYGAIKSKKENK